MKTDKEILDEFGKLVACEVFDSGFGMITEVLYGTTPNPLRKKTASLFDKFDANEKDEIKKYLHDAISGSLFEFLRIFEENEQFKIYYEKDGQKVNLNEISEMLKAEPIIENGWIARFSKEVNKDEII